MKKKHVHAPKGPPEPKPDSREPWRIVHADFVAGAGPGAPLPPPTMVEVAFAGRSNVGKSSLINALVERKSLVRTSSKPGSTRQINFYETSAVDGSAFCLVDLPGYGFTRRSKTETAAWGDLVEGYLAARVTLAAVVVIADVRRGLEADDLELIEFIRAAGAEAQRREVSLVLVATKLDKLGKSERKVALEKLKKACGGLWIGFSATTGEGRAALWTALRKAALGTHDSKPA